MDAQRGPIAYGGTKTLHRTNMVAGSYGLLANASTTAVRYLCIREQGFADSQAEDPFQAGERKVLDYQLHQYRVFKAVAFTYLMFWNIKYMQNFFKTVRDGMMYEAS